MLKQLFKSRRAFFVFSIAAIAYSFWFIGAAQKPYITPTNFVVFCIFFIAPTLGFIFYYLTFAENALNARSLLQYYKAKGRSTFILKIAVYLFPALSSATLTYLILLLPVFPTLLWARSPLNALVTIRQIDCAETGTNDVDRIKFLNAAHDIKAVYLKTNLCIHADKDPQKIEAAIGHRALLKGRTWFWGDYIQSISFADPRFDAAEFKDGILNKESDEIILPPDDVTTAIAAPLKIEKLPFRKKLGQDAY